MVLACFIKEQSFQKSNAQRAQDHENKLSRRSRPFSQGGTLGHWNGRGDQEGKKGEKNKRREREREKGGGESEYVGKKGQKKETG